MDNHISKTPTVMGSKSDEAKAPEMSRYWKFVFLVSGIIFFFGCHNYMQELIMNLPGFKVGVFLGYLEVLGVAFCSFFERRWLGDMTRKAPWSAYVGLTFCLLVSSATSNIALAYINYPTKVVFRSCKLVPTMLIASGYNHKKVMWFEYLFGGFISLGMVLFAFADFQVYPNFNFIGITLVCISVCADAFLPNFQERVFDEGSSRIEVTYYTNLLTLSAMTVGFSASGDLPTAFAYAFANPAALKLMLIYTFLAYIAITFHMALVKEFGGVTTVLVGNMRKAMTICLSFFFFPKPMSLYYVGGGVLVFGSLISNTIMKEKDRAAGKAAYKEEQQQLLQLNANKAPEVEFTIAIPSPVSMGTAHPRQKSFA